MEARANQGSRSFLPWGRNRHSIHTLQGSTKRKAKDMTTRTFMGLRDPLRFLGFWLAALPVIASPCVAKNEKPARLMPFLCRGAVVRESQARFPLVQQGSEPPTHIVQGTIREGPRARLQERPQIRLHLEPRPA